MDIIAPEFLEGFDNPLDGLAEILNDNQWPFDRPSDDRMNFEVYSDGHNYRFSLIWEEAEASMRVNCKPGIKIHKNSHQSVYALLNRVNAQLGIGAFIVEGEGDLIFRYTTLFRGISASGADHVEAIVDTGVEQCTLYLDLFRSYQSPAGFANDNPGVQMDLGLILARTLGNA